jgi:transglutaminase-like putative cysteine protease
MLIRFGHEIRFQILAPTAMVLHLLPHPSIQHKLAIPEITQVDPDIKLHRFTDPLGNDAVRLLAPAGDLRLFYQAVIKIDGLADRIDMDCEEWPVNQLPDKILPYLFGSRCCEVELLTPVALQLFGNTNSGWDRVRAICDWVHTNIAVYQYYVRPTQTAFETYNACRGAVRDLTHLAIAFCRAMNIPARYCTGYAGPGGVLPNPLTQDFSPWFEAFLGGEWFTFDACDGIPNVGRILVAQGKDARDTVATHSFGSTEVIQFSVWSGEVKSSESELYDLLGQYDTV